MNKRLDSTRRAPSQSQKPAFLLPRRSARGFLVGWIKGLGNKDTLFVSPAGPQP